VFSKEHQLMDVDIIRYKFLNCGLFARGQFVEVGQIHDTIRKFSQKISMPIWNQNAFKVGVCTCPPPGLV
ncbi:MAG: hypothetical protein EZS28_042589, partial [Streblomastix strix]